MRRGIALGLLLALLGVLAAGLAAAPASAAPGVNGVFDLPGGPKDIARGPDGNLWVTLDGTGPQGEDIAKVTPAGVVTGYDSAVYQNPVGITAGPDDHLWLVQSGAVVEVDPADPENPTATPIAAISDPRGITEGPDDNLWAASGEKVVRIPPANPAGFTEFDVPGMGARGIAAGPNLIWVADFAGGRIVSLTTAGVPTPYDVGGGPQEVAGALSTSQVAFANPGAAPQEIGRITPGDEPQRTQTPNKDPFGVALGGDGAWWFAQFASNDLGRLTNNGNYTSLGGLPAAAGPRQIASGPNNTLWVTLETSQQVARVTGVTPPVQTAPETMIDAAPGEVVKAGKKGATVKFEFFSPTATASFECSLKRKRAGNDREDELAEFAPCESPKRYRKLRKGAYVFKVRARANGRNDPTPARAAFRVKHR